MIIGILLEAFVIMYQNWIIYLQESELIEAAEEREHLPVKFRLNIQDVIIEWETIIWQHRLYVIVPMPFVREGSKEG